MATQQYDDIVARETIPSSDVTRVRFGEIDGLRALAIVAAVIYEATRLTAPGSAWNPILSRVFWDASQGLPLFFLLSGFALAYPALATLRADGRTYLDVGRYIVKRVLRIYPAYLLVLALAFIVPPLALQYGLPALASGAPVTSTDGFFQNLFFVGDGLGNDGFRALALEARWYLLFPLVLLLWARSPRVFFALMVVAAACDLSLASAHAWGVGALVPFMLGIVAADVRAGHHRFERFGFLVAAAAAVAAVIVERFLGDLPGPLGAPGALRIDPLWSAATFGLLVGAGASPIVERVLSLRVLRIIGAASYGTALVVVPVASFIVRQVVLSFGPAGTAANAALFSFLGGIVIWQLADRWFADGTLRRDAADLVGPWLNAVLHIVRIDRVTLGVAPSEFEFEEDGAVDADFYAPPPRSNGELAVVSMRTGSPEELAAEILETKKRLSDRSSAIFAEAEPQPEPEPAALPVLKPGFYRREAPAKVPARSVPDSPRAPQPRPEPAHHEPAPRAAHTEAPAYEHYTFEPAAPPPVAEPPRQPQLPPQPAQQASPPPRPAGPLPVAATPPVGAPNTRGPIKMRIGALGPEGADGSANANGVRRREPGDGRT